MCEYEYSGSFDCGIACKEHGERGIVHICGEELEDLRFQLNELRQKNAGLQNELLVVRGYV